MLDLVDGLRELLVLHPALSPTGATPSGLTVNALAEPPYDGWESNTLYVFEAEDADERALEGVGPQDRENFDVLVVVTGPDLGEASANRPSREVSERLDAFREAILATVRNNRSRYAASLGPPLAGQPTPWGHIQGRGDIRFARTIGARVAACRVTGWRIIPTS